VIDRRRHRGERASTGQDGVSAASRRLLATASPAGAVLVRRIEGRATA
jgi:hypothetical protein